MSCEGLWGALFKGPPPLSPPGRASAPGRRGVFLSPLAPEKRVVVPMALVDTGSSDCELRQAASARVGRSGRIGGWGACLAGRGDGVWDVGMGGDLIRVDAFVEALFRLTESKSKRKRCNTQRKTPLLEGGHVDFEDAPFLACSMTIHKMDRIFSGCKSGPVWFPNWKLEMESNVSQCM